MVLIGEVLTQIRNQALDIDAAATNHAVQTQASQAKNLAVKALAQHLVESLRQKIPVETEHESQARIRELDGQLGDLQQQLQRQKNCWGACPQQLFAKDTSSLNTCRLSHIRGPQVSSCCIGQPHQHPLP